MSSLKHALQIRRKFNQWPHIASANVNQACQFITLASYYKRYIQCDKFQKKLQCCSERMFNKCICHDTHAIRITFYSAHWLCSTAIVIWEDEYLQHKNMTSQYYIKLVLLILLIIIDALSRLFHTNTIHCVCFSLFVQTTHKVGTAKFPSEQSVSHFKCQTLCLHSQSGITDNCDHK